MKIGASIIAIVEDSAFVTKIQAIVKKEQASLVILTHNGVSNHDIAEVKNAEVVSLEKACELCEKQGVVFYTNSPQSKKRLGYQGIQSEAL